MNRKFLLIISALAVAIVLMIVVVSFPKVVFEVDNFQATLEQASIHQGADSTFVTDANFTITNTGNKDSVSFTIFVETIGVSRSISIDPIEIHPIKVGETRVIALEGYPGQGYPTLILRYEDDSHKFRFGDRIMVEFWSLFG